MSPLLRVGFNAVRDVGVVVGAKTLRRIKRRADFSITLANAKSMPWFGKYFARLRLPVYVGHPQQTTPQCGKVIAIEYDVHDPELLNVIFKLYRPFPELPFISPTFKMRNDAGIDNWEPIKLEYIGLTDSPRLIEEPYTSIENYLHEERQ